VKEQETTRPLKRQLSRRDFLGTVATATVFTIVPRYVLGGGGHTPPSEKLNIALVGVGGKGRSNTRNLSSENIVALCDVDEKRAAETFEKFPKAKKYHDFRKMLEKEGKNIDAVVVTTPDHTHAAISMAAMQTGKHVYCEKPLTHTISEARLLAKTAREAKLATQMGNSGQASEEVRLLCEWIWDGAIGPVREVHKWTDRPVDYWPQGIDRPKQTPLVPTTLDWDLWLGPAPYRPYNPAYVPFTWRGWWDFGTGALGDMGCHGFDPIFRALKLGHPISVEATSTPVFAETYPLASVVRYKFPARGDMPPVELTWYDGGLKPAIPDELEPGRKFGKRGVIYIGDKGKMMNGRIIPEKKMQEYEKPPKTLPRSAGHYKEWVEACKGGKPAGSNFDFAALVTEVVLLGNIALRTGEKLYWDGPSMEITNVPEANQYLQTEYRQGWRL
jgi:predicted dehydrogenase